MSVILCRFLSFGFNPLSFCYFLLLTPQLTLCQSLSLSLSQPLLFFWLFFFFVCVGFFCFFFAPGHFLSAKELLASPAKRHIRRREAISDLICSSQHEGSRHQSGPASTSDHSEPPAARAICQRCPLALLTSIVHCPASLR